MLDTGPRRLDALIALIDGAQHSAADHLLHLCRRRRGRARARGADRGGDARRRGVADRRRVRQRARRTSAFLRAAARGGRRRLPLRAALGPALSAAQPPEARARRRRRRARIIGGFNVEDGYFGTPAEQAWRDLGLLVEGPAARAHRRLFRRAVGAGRKRPHGAAARAAAALVTLERAERARRAGCSAGRRGGCRPGRGGQARPAHARGASTSSPPISRRAPACCAGSTGRAARRARADRDCRRRIGSTAPRSRRRASPMPGCCARACEIYEYQPTKLHTKLFVIDDVVYIGSANYDMRSLFLNLEMMLRIEDKAFAAHVRALCRRRDRRLRADHRRQLYKRAAPAGGRAAEAGGRLFRDHRARL